MKKSFCDIATESLLALVDWEEKFMLADRWLKENDQMTWARIVENAVMNFITDEDPKHDARDAAAEIRVLFMVNARKLWFSQLEQEHYDAIMLLFRTGAIRRFLTAYGEEMYMHLFETHWHTFRENATETV